MIKTLSENQFIREFNDVRPESFSDAALSALYEYMMDIAPEWELDIVGLDCDFAEYTLEELRDNFPNNAPTLAEYELDDIDDWARQLNKETTVLTVAGGESLIVQGF